MTKTKTKLNQLLGKTLVYNLLGVGFLFVFQWLLTKVLPQEKVGEYNYFNNLIQLGLLVIPLGYPLLAVREVNKFNVNELKHFHKQGVFAVLIGSLVYGCIVFYGVQHLSWIKGNYDSTTLYLSILIMPVFGLFTVYRGSLQGLNKTMAFVLPDNFFRPLILVIILGIIYLNASYISPFELIGLSGMIILLFTIYSFVIVKNNIPQGEKVGKNYFKQALLLLPIVALFNINERIDSFMITSQLGTKDLAIYNIASKFALFSAFGLTIMNQVVPQIIAKHLDFDRNTHPLLQKILKSTTRKAFIVSLLISIALCILSPFALNFFGQDGENYQLAYWSMVILILGQLFNVALGSVGYILTMAHLEKLSLFAIFVSMIVNVLMNKILIPIYGLEGAALATTLAVVTWNSIMFVFVQRKVNLNPSIF